MCLSESLVTSALTILGAVCVFALGQIILKWLIEPIQDLRRTRSEVLFFLVHKKTAIYTHQAFEKDEILAIGKDLEQLGARLLAHQHAIPFYGRILPKICNLPKHEDILCASRQMSRISNRLFPKHSSDYEELDACFRNVCSALNFDPEILDVGNANS